MTYEAAKQQAQAAADATGFDHGVEKDAFGYHMHMLPEKANRRGFETCCEVVSATDLAKCRRGHGPVPS